MLAKKFYKKDKIVWVRVEYKKRPSCCSDSCFIYHKCGGFFSYYSDICCRLNINVVNYKYAPSET